MPLILVPSSAKRDTNFSHCKIKLEALRLNNFILRGFVCDIIRPTKELSRVSTRIMCIKNVSVLTIFNINDVSGVVLVSLLLTVNIFQTSF